MVFLGANNALGASPPEGGGAAPGYDDLRRKGDYTVWRPDPLHRRTGPGRGEVQRIRRGTSSGAPSRT